MFYKNVQLLANNRKFRQPWVLSRDEFNSVFFFNRVKMKLSGSKVTFRKISINQRVIKGWKAPCCFRKRKAMLWLKTPEDTSCVMAFFYISLVHLIIRYNYSHRQGTCQIRQPKHSFLKTIGQSFLFKSNLGLW